MACCRVLSLLAVALLICASQALAGATIRTIGGGRFSYNVTPLKTLQTRKINIQRYDYTCGAAALSSILQYQYDEQVDEGDVIMYVLRNRLSTIPVIQRKGLSLLQLKKVALHYGYKAIGYGQMTVADLAALNVPAIVPVHLYGFDHFLLFTGMIGDRVFLADPSSGNITMRRHTFDEAWKGRIGFILLPDNPEWQAQAARVNRMRPRLADMRFPLVRFGIPSLQESVIPQQPCCPLLSPARLTTP